MKQKGIELRMKILRRYSGETPTCACCPETAYEFLTIDHIDGGGLEQRRQIGLSGRSVYKWIIDNDFPPLFQVLCYNCNFAKGSDGKCPHN